MLPVDILPKKEATWFTLDYEFDSPEAMETYVIGFRKLGWLCTRIDYVWLKLRVAVDWEKRPKAIDSWTAIAALC